MTLVEIARKQDWSEWTPERRERIFAKVMAGVAHERARRRAVRVYAFAAAACTVLLLGLLLRVAGLDVVPLIRSAPELAGKAEGRQRVSAE